MIEVSIGVENKQVLCPMFALNYELPGIRISHVCKILIPEEYLSFDDVGTLYFWTECELSDVLPKHVVYVNVTVFSYTHKVFTIRPTHTHNWSSFPLERSLMQGLEITLTVKKWSV